MKSFAVLFLMIFSFILVGCDSLSEEEKGIVGKYELIEISIAGYPAVNVNIYDYFTIEFKSNKKCTVSSKVGVTTSEATATWKVNSNGEIEVVAKSIFAKATEIYTYEDIYYLRQTLLL